MTNLASARRLRIPVQYTDGIWECALGGAVPVKPGTEAELLVERTAITDKAFLKAMQAPGLHKVLDEGVTLLIGLTIKMSAPPSADLGKHLKNYRSIPGGIATHLIPSWKPDTLQFAEVKLASPDQKQSRRFDTNRGGLWLETKGVQATGLASTTIILPEAVSKKPVASLNHAFTKLSEAYETWRISHTGNIYTRVLYQERNERWYPLEVLRNRALSQAETSIANELWAAFLAKMTIASKPSDRK